METNRNIYVSDNNGDHVPANLDKLYENGKIFKPSEKEVMDVRDTIEKWITQKLR